MTVGGTISIDGAEWKIEQITKNAQGADVALITKGEEEAWYILPVGEQPEAMATNPGPAPVVPPGGAATVYGSWAGETIHTDVFSPPADEEADVQAPEGN